VSLRLLWSVFEVALSVFQRIVPKSHWPESYLGVFVSL
jgi:hypothetical protein